jgi:hypothetical protein
VSSTTTTTTTRNEEATAVFVVVDVNSAAIVWYRCCGCYRMVPLLRLRLLLLLLLSCIAVNADTLMLPLLLFLFRSSHRSNVSRVRRANFLESLYTLDVNVPGFSIFSSRG